MQIPPDLTFRSPDGSPYTEPLASRRFYLEREYRIILVHGFRNSEVDAINSYDVFRSHFSMPSSIFASKMFYLVWPGDSFGGRIISWFDYNVNNALDAGQAFASFLNDLIAKESSECEFVIIAHSLGCRLTAAMMSALRILNPEACSRFTLFLMAGAVPKSDLDRDGVFEMGLRAAKYVANYFSPADRVLRMVFPLGELGGHRFPTEAIGLNGLPVEFAWSQREHMTDFGHGDYWTNKLAAESVARALGVAVPKSLPINECTSHWLPEYTLP